MVEKKEADQSFSYINYIAILVSVTPIRLKNERQIA